MHAVHFYILPFPRGKGPPGESPCLRFKGRVTGWAKGLLALFRSGWGWGKGLVLGDKISYYGEQGDDEDLRSGVERAWDE